MSLLLQLIQLKNGNNIELIFWVTIKTQFFNGNNYLKVNLKLFRNVLIVKSVWQMLGEKLFFCVVLFWPQWEKHVLVSKVISKLFSVLCWIMGVRRVEKCLSWNFRISWGTKTKNQFSEFENHFLKYEILFCYR